jgi:hypothetical protein
LKIEIIFCQFKQLKFLLQFNAFKMCKKVSKKLNFQCQMVDTKIAKRFAMKIKVSERPEESIDWQRRDRNFYGDRDLHNKSFIWHNTISLERQSDKKMLMRCIIILILHHNVRAFTQTDSNALR